MVKATPNVDIPSTPSLKNVIGGAIIGTENNVFNGVMEEYRNEIRNNEEQMELASASLKVIQTTMEMIGGFFISGGAKDLIDRIEEVKKLATRDSINSNMETFFGSKEHDGLIPRDNQKITPNVMNNFIAVEMDRSNVELKVFHVIAKQTSWKNTDELYNDDDAKKQYATIEEAQNRNVRDQLRRWVQVVK